MTQKFQEKLKELEGTIKYAFGADNDDMASACRRLNEFVMSSYHLPRVLSVGSGGSYVSASHFTAMLQMKYAERGEFATMTPVELSYAPKRGNTAVVIFSASGRSPDTEASILAAKNIVEKPADCILVTLNPELGESHPGIMKAVVESENRKDGFIATHSMIATAIASLKGLYSHGDELENGREEIIKAYSTAVDGDGGIFRGMTRETLLLLIRDPCFKPFSDLLETSIWETGLCTVQATDNRNFAHGRHAGVFNNYRDARIVFLQEKEYGTEDVITRISCSPVMNRTEKATPVSVTASLLTGLGIIGKIGQAVVVDPSNPYNGKAPDFARLLYKHEGFRDSLKS